MGQIDQVGLSPVVRFVQLANFLCHISTDLKDSPFLPHLSSDQGGIHSVEDCSISLHCLLARPQAPPQYTQCANQRWARQH